MQDRVDRRVAAGKLLVGETFHRPAGRGRVQAFAGAQKIGRPRVRAAAIRLGQKRSGYSASPPVSVAR